MPRIVKHFWPCIKVICKSINNRQKITYGDLANELGLRLAKQEWSSLLDLIAGKTRRELGDDYDLTWNVVYGSGPAAGLGRYFSNGGRMPGSTLLNPRDRYQVGEYENKLKEIYKFTYAVQRVGDQDKVVKAPRTS